MAGISSNALKSMNYQENRRKYNGIEHTTDLDLNQYDAFYRTLDPQLGRWWQIDPKPDYSLSPYSSMGDNPISKTDFLGDTLVDGNKKNVSYQIDKDGNVSWSKNASKDMMRIGNAMAKTEIGRKILQKMSEAKHDISMSIDTKNLVKERGLTILGKTFPTIRNDNKTLISSKIVLCEKSIIDVNTAPEGFIKTAKILGNTIYTSKLDIGTIVGGVGVHEGTHATDKGSITAQNPLGKYDEIEQVPRENELKYYQELNKVQNK